MTATQLRLYNTLTRSKEDFVPIDPANVRMYVCGPTVYDFAHIGNARPVIVFDVLYRLLRHIYGKDHVKYVRNITDVDDKINARALRDHPGLPLNDAIALVTKTTAEQFQADAKALGCLEPDVQPRATDNIAEMIDIIGKLLDNGYAYIATGPEGREVLFATEKMADYGQLSKRKLDEQQSGARIAVEAHKKSPGDFVLWKESSANEPGWHAEFRPDADYRSNAENVAIFGRPGWHIECSAMSHRYLGETFDIHGGGLDLIFPHHENEIAQSRCAFGRDVMAKVWMHNGFLQVEGEKMSKSLGNFVTISDLLHTDKFGGRKWPGEVLRLAMLMTHYRSPIDWTVTKLNEAHTILRGWDATVYRARRERIDHFNDEAKIPEEILSALLDDLNTSGLIFQLNRLLAGATEVNNPLRDKAVSQLWSCMKLMGLHTLYQSNAEKIDEASIVSLITARLTARKAKDFKESDRIRDELLAMGIQLKDGKDIVTGEMTTSWEVKR